MKLKFNNFITETELMSIVNDLSVDPAIVIIASLLKFLLSVVE